MLALAAPNIEDHATLLNFEQTAKILGGGTTGQVLTADANGNAAWGLSGGIAGQVLRAAGAAGVAAFGPRILYGTVSATGTIALAGSGDWTSARTGGQATGVYTVTYTTGFTAQPSVLLTPLTSAIFATANLAPVGTGTATFEVQVYSLPGGGAANALADCEFQFVVVGL